jgi:penicillin-binding protein 1A
MNSILREPSAMAPRRPRTLNRKDLAGKTGTTTTATPVQRLQQRSRRQSWVGFDQNQPLGKGETGGRAALPMWIDYMRVVLEGAPEKPLVPPSGIVTTHINRDTGKPTAPSDPNAMLEYFIEGTAESSTDVLEGGTAPAPEGVREGLF